MGKKIFVSYKYADDSVKNLEWWENSTVRDYVTKFEEKLDSDDHIYKGEHEDEDLSGYSEETIWAKLKDRIYDSSVTIVFISPNMKEEYSIERNQWIPWEISYSLKEVSRHNKKKEPVTSKSNAMLAVVLPDINGSYSYYLEEKSCCSLRCTMHHTNKLFYILQKNKFNLKDPNTRECSNNSTIWYGEYSYIEAVKWCDFINNYNLYIEKACKRQDNIENYTIEKEIS